MSLCLLSFMYLDYLVLQFILLTPRWRTWPFDCWRLYWFDISDFIEGILLDCLRLLPPKLYLAIELLKSGFGLISITKLFILFLHSFRWPKEGILLHLICVSSNFFSQTKLNSSPSPSSSKCYSIVFKSSLLDWISFDPLFYDSLF
jgi:hypothetical protein